MKRLFVVVAVILAVCLSPLAAYAEGHDQQWNQRHTKEWKSHSKQWSEYDREWQAHRGDSRWRKEHAATWREWYQWHKDDDGKGGLILHLDLTF